MRPVSTVQPDGVIVESVRGVAASMVLTLTDPTTGAVYDLTGLTPLCELWTGDPDDPAATFTTVPSTPTVLTGLVTLSWTMAQSLAVALGRYGWRLRLFDGAECVEQLLHGQWTHVEV